MTDLGKNEKWDFGFDVSFRLRRWHFSRDIMRGNWVLEFGPFEIDIYWSLPAKDTHHD